MSLLISLAEDYLLAYLDDNPMLAATRLTGYSPGAILSIQVSTSLTSLLLKLAANGSNRIIWENKDPSIPRSEENL